MLWAMPPSVQPSPRTYRSTRREGQAERTRQRVLDAASALFVTCGYAGTTVRQIAATATVSVPMVEMSFGTKARILHAAINVAIAGDDDPVPVLDRGWTQLALQTDSVDGFLAIVAQVLAPAQARSAGLLLTLFEASTADSSLAELAERMIAQRGATAEWIVDGLASRAALHPELTRDEAVDTTWILMDPALFDRLIRQRQWTSEQYRSWFARSARRLLLADPATAADHTPHERRTR